MTSVQSSKISINRNTVENVVAFLICPIALLSPHATVIPLIILGLMHILFMDFRSIFPFNKAILAASATLLFGLVTAIWSVDPLNSFFVGVRLLFLLLAGFVWIKGNDRSDLLLPLFYGFILSFGFMIIDAKLGYLWSQFLKKTESKTYVQLGLTLSLAIFPLSTYLFKNKQYIALGVLLPVSLWALPFSACDAAKLAVSVGVIGAISLYTLGNRVLTLARTLVIVVNFTLPAIFYYGITDSFIEKMTHIPKFGEDSYIHRLLIWREVSHIIKDRPLFGYGLDASRHDSVGGGKISYSYYSTVFNHRINLESKKIPLHPHNYILQWWLELGLAGVVLGNIFIWYLFKRMALVRDKAVKAGYFGLFCASAVIAGVNLGFWQNWWLAVLMIMVGFMRPLNTYGTNTNE